MSEGSSAADVRSAPPSTRSIISIVKCTLIGAFVFLASWSIIDFVQRQRGTAHDGAANVKDLPALQMVVAHFSSKGYHDIMIQLANEIFRGELFWLSVIYIIAQRPIRAFFNYGKHYEDNRNW